VYDTKVTLKKVEEGYYHGYYEGKQILGGKKSELVRMMKLMVQGIMESERKKLT
jgi:hypothetical protein